MASRRPIGLCATLAAICAAGPLAAQQADPPPAVVATPLDAVTATGTRMPTVSGDSVAPVSVLSREEILERDARSVTETIRDVPGVELSGEGRTTALQPLIRGLGDDRIVFRIDGARNNFNAGHRGRIFIDPELLRQIDVMRGPGSALYGSGAIGGVINMRTIEPDDIIQPDSELPVGGFFRGGYRSQGGMWRGLAAGAARAGDFAVLGAISGFNNSNFTGGAGNTIPYTAGSVANGLARLQWRPGNHQFDLSGMWPQSQANPSRPPESLISLFRRERAGKVALYWPFSRGIFGLGRAELRELPAPFPIDRNREYQHALQGKLVAFRDSGARSATDRTGLKTLHPPRRGELSCRCAAIESA